MRIFRAERHAAFGTLALVAALVAALAAPAGSQEEGEEFDFDVALARVDAAIRQNPAHAIGPALDSCIKRRDIAVRLYNSGQHERAERSLRYCFQVLHVSDAPKAVARPKGPTPEEMQARAQRELEKALALTPDVDRGLAIYRSCAGCHMPEGWGLHNGSVPQIAGQHRRVVIKQLADIRAGHRNAFLMLPYASVESIGGAQAVADVAAYVDTLEISPRGGKGPGEDLALGEKLYRESCARCHGAQGEGDGEKFIPRIQSQHYRYLLRQLERIRDGERANADPEMADLVHDLGEREMRALADYVSRLAPPPELAAPEGWRNPDFAD